MLVLTERSNTGLHALKSLGGLSGEAANARSDNPGDSLCRYKTMNHETIFSGGLIGWGEAADAGNGMRRAGSFSMPGCAAMPGPPGDLYFPCGFSPHNADLDSLYLQVRSFSTHKLIK